MGTWAEGLLDNDAAWDGLGDLHNGVVEDIVTFGAAKPTASSTAKLCAAVGVLLQLAAYDFGLDTESGPQIVTAVTAHAKAIAKLPTPARKIMEAVMAGEGKALAERPDKMAAARAALLHQGAKTSPFGKRESALFATKPAAAYVQEIARRCADGIDEDFEEEDTWSDLAREAMSIGMLAPLMVLEPCKVAPSKIARWRRQAKAGLAQLLEEEDDDGELDFHKPYYANLDKIFAVLQKRFGGNRPI